MQAVLLATVVITLLDNVTNNKSYLRVWLKVRAQARTLDSMVPLCDNIPLPAKHNTIDNTTIIKVNGMTGKRKNNNNNKNTLC